MNTILGLGKEFIYENLVSYGDYKEYKTLKQLSSSWYEMLDQPFFRDVSSTEINDYEVKTFHRNCLTLRRTYWGVRSFNGDFQHGPYIEYNMVGGKTRESLYLDGLRVGDQREYYPTSGAIKFITKCGYDNGKGSYVEYDDKGTIIEKGLCWNTTSITKDGPYRRLYPNRVVSETGVYYLNVKKGASVLYGLDGKMIEIRNHTDSDNWTYTKYSDGMITEVGVYTNNIKQDYKEFNGDGKIVRMREGYKTTEIVFDSDGVLIQETDFQHNKYPKQIRKFNKLGKLYDGYNFDYKSHGCYEKDGKWFDNYGTYTTHRINGEPVECGVYKNRRLYRLRKTDVGHLNLTDFKYLCKERGIKSLSKLKREEIIDLLI